MTAEQIAAEINPQLRGWINYYGRFYPSALNALWRILDARLIRWIRLRYKRYRWHKGKAAEVLRELRQKHAELFAHWKFAVRLKS